jgi:hypothetical protein
MARSVLVVLLWGLLASSAGAQTLTERYAFGTDLTFRGRVLVAAMQAALAVTSEETTVPNHAERMALASKFLDDPEILAQRLALMAASVEVVNVSVTDAELKTLFADKWTLLALIYTGQRWFITANTCTTS